MTTTLQTSLMIRGDLDLQSADTEKDRILDFLDENAKADIVLDINLESCTQPSIQIFLATVEEALARDVSVSPGSNEFAQHLYHLHAAKKI